MNDDERVMETDLAEAEADLERLLEGRPPDASGPWLRKWEWQRDAARRSVARLRGNLEQARADRTDR